MITSSNHLTNGRLGNKLFRFASLTGIAEKYGTELTLPYDKEFDVFEGPFNWGNLKGGKINEQKFDYIEMWGYFHPGIIYDLNGYFQSRKYWKNCEDYVKSALTFNPEFIQKVTKGYDFSKETIAIHIRRGDYIGNSNYYNLPIHYFILSLFSIKGWKEKNIIIFSDDIDYCKVHFQCLDNVKFSEGKTAIEDLCLMSQCDHFVLSNSSFAWWGAYLGQKEHSIVIRPNYLFDGRLKQVNNDKDFWPEEWTCFDHVGKKIDLSDVTFTIPVKYDHKDRKDNLDLCIRQLDQNFCTNIIIGEQGGERLKFDHLSHIKFFENCFHRTKMLNIMANDVSCHTPIIFNWDADVLIAPLQIWCAVEKLRDKYDMVFPYDGRFARMPREQWFSKINNSNDIGVVGKTILKGMEPNAAVSVGGAVGFKKASFIAGGMENENFVSYSPEDVEREIRFKRLGYKIDRVNGPLYHMNHWCGVDSGVSNPYFKQGQEELEKVKNMSFSQLEEYVKSWNWIR